MTPACELAVSEPPAAAPLESAVPAAQHDAEEAALMERVRVGDPEAFDLLVNRHMRRAFAVAYRLLGQREDAEDLVQEAFLLVLQKVDTYQAGRSFGPWFYRILVNRGLNARKSRALRVMSVIPPETAAPGRSPLSDAERAELRDGLAAAMAELPERQRTVVQLFDLEGFSSQEIAEILDLSDGTVRWHLHQARQRLRETLARFARRQP